MRANATELENAFYAGTINCHLHRKIIRTDLYKEAISAMPDYVKQKWVCRFEDELQFAFLISKMQRHYVYVRVLGEIRYWGLPDNSLSRAYHTRAELAKNTAWIKRVIMETFHKINK
jgi:hypothetical protein